MIWKRKGEETLQTTKQVLRNNLPFSSQFLISCCDEYASTCVYPGKHILQNNTYIFKCKDKYGVVMYEHRNILLCANNKVKGLSTNK